MFARCFKVYVSRSKPLGSVLRWTDTVEKSESIHRQFCQSKDTQPGLMGNSWGHWLLPAFVGRSWDWQMTCPTATHLSSNKKHFYSFFFHFFLSSFFLSLISYFMSSLLYFLPWQFLLPFFLSSYCFLFKFPVFLPRLLSFFFYLPSLPLVPSFFYPFTYFCFFLALEETFLLSLFKRDDVCPPAPWASFPPPFLFHIHTHRFQILKSDTFFYAQY